MKKIKQGSMTKTTMTVGELREALYAWEDDLPVFATWETIYTEFQPDNIGLNTQDFSEPCLIIDVDQY